MDFECQSYRKWKHHSVKKFQTFQDAKEAKKAARKEARKEAEPKKAEEASIDMLDIRYSAPLSSSLSLHTCWFQPTMRSFLRQNRCKTLLICLRGKDTAKLHDQKHPHGAKS